MATKRMTKKQAAEISRMAEIVERLKTIYPDVVCALEWGGQHGGEWDFLLQESWKLLVMGRLSAQCTDARVNIVCKDLFEKFPTVQSMAEGAIEDIEAIVRPCGLYHTKARNLKDSCGKLVDEFGGVLPSDMETLLTFPGVGRKIANLLRGDVFGLGGIVADTHCIRICGRFGMYPTDMKDPTKVEMIMKELIAPSEQSDFCHRIVQFGRDTCSARSPKCDECPIRDLCGYKNKKA